MDDAHQAIHGHADTTAAGHYQLRNSEPPSGPASLSAGLSSAAALVLSALAKPRGSAGAKQRSSRGSCETPQSPHVNSGFDSFATEPFSRRVCCCPKATIMDLPMTGSIGAPARRRAPQKAVQGCFRPARNPCGDADGRCTGFLGTPSTGISHSAARQVGTSTLTLACFRGPMFSGIHELAGPRASFGGKSLSIGYR